MSFLKSRTTIIKTFPVLIDLAMIGSVDAKTTRMILENGKEMVFKENYGSPMMAAVIFIRAGAKYETPFNNGVTHLFESLLFDGTHSRTRQMIPGRIKTVEGTLTLLPAKT